MSGPRRRDRSPRGSVALPKAPKSVKKEIELYTPVVKPENPRNDVQEARLLSRELFLSAFPEEKQAFPCGNLLCEFCEHDHKERLKRLGDSDIE